MAKYSVLMQRTASASAGIGNVSADATRPRRFKLFYIGVGSEGTVGDNPFLWQVQRSTTAASGGSAVTPQALEPADAATEMDAVTGAITDGTLTSNAMLWTLPLNQRATHSWWAPPGGELVFPATASNGFHLRTPTAGAAVSITATCHIDEQ